MEKKKSTVHTVHTSMLDVLKLEFNDGRRSEQWVRIAIYEVETPSELPKNIQQTVHYSSCNRAHTFLYNTILKKKRKQKDE
jgi:hypothetical protein